MKKIFTLILPLLILGGCSFNFAPIENQENQNNSMTEAEARAIAEKDCIKGGETLDPGSYNENSKTWWFDANLNVEKEGCNPACVVSEETKTAEINWRCTGLILSEDESAQKLIKQIFIEKYPEYADTIEIKLTHETGDYVRGEITFVPGQGGGIFLAVKDDGEWQIVHEGNGSISCDLEEYGFPEDMLYDCAE